MALVAVALLALSGCNDFFAAGWGSDRYSQLGTADLQTVNAPVAVDTEGILRDKVIVQVDAGGWPSCALAADGTASCWGAAPPLGTGLTEPILPSEFPMTGVFAGKVITKVAASTLWRCALTSDGLVGCYDRPGSTNVVPKAGPLAGKQVVLLEVGEEQGCAVTYDGVVACWPTRSPQPADPVQMNATGLLAGQRILDLAKGNDFMCALYADEFGLPNIACWGKNDRGQLGDGTTNDSATPVLVNDDVLMGDGISGIGGGEGTHMCATAGDGMAFCWGYNYHGQLGDGTTTSSSTMVKVAQVGALAGKKVVATATGGAHTCALLDDDSVACWGSSYEGQLGDGVTPILVDPEQKSLIPVAVKALPGADGQPRPVLDLAAGGGHNMAVYQEVPASHFYPITPHRVLDTRALGSGSPISESVAFGIEGVVPGGATAVTYNLTATGQTASGVALMAPADSPVTVQQSSVINWGAPQQTIANGFVVRVGADRRLKVSLGSTGTSHFVVDITGYFKPPAGGGTGSLLVTADQRLYDSRSGDGKLQPGQSRVVTAPDAQAKAVAVNVTATGTEGSGVFSVAGGVTAATSAVNWSGPNQTIANAVVTDVVGGRFTVTNNGSTAAHVVVDVSGVFVSTEVGIGAAFFPTDPVRTYDSRMSNGLLPAGIRRATTHPVPQDAVAVALNTTVTGTVGTGYISVASAGSGLLATSSVNWYGSPTTRANGSFVPVDATASRAFVGGSYGTQYVHDAAGFFR